MQSNDLTTSIKKVLSSKPLSARDILRDLKKVGVLEADSRRTEVNKILYALHKNGEAMKTDTTPPLWTSVPKDDSRSSSESESEANEITEVLIFEDDLRCADKASKFANDRTYIVSIFQKEAIMPNTTLHPCFKIEQHDLEDIPLHAVFHSTKFVMDMARTKSHARFILATTDERLISFVRNNIAKKFPRVEFQFPKTWEELEVLIA